MEKHHVIARIPHEAHGSTAAAHKQRWDLGTRNFLISLLCLCGLVLLPVSQNQGWWRVESSTNQSSQVVGGFDWDSAVSKPHLEYAQCYGGEFQCARLELPMDYWNGSTNATISLAVIRRPAAVPVTDPRYGGPVLINPGGPGGSGIQMVLGAGSAIGRRLDAVSEDSDGKFFDVVSFDPRGVGETRPQAVCVEDPGIAQSFMLRMSAQGNLGTSDAGLGRLWSMVTALSQTCSLPPRDGEADIKRYLSTASVARDMLELIEAHGAWREKEAVRLLRKGGCGHSSTATVPSDLKHVRGTEKLQYWGFSYGTYLGMTYAAMFPDRVHRVVLDGVVDAEDYTRMLWFNNLVDTERDMDLMYYHCARVGWPTCALANVTEPTTVEGVRQRVYNIIRGLYHNPMPVSGPNPEVIEYSDVKNMIFQALYSPVRSFHWVASLLSDLEKGNGTVFAKALLPRHRPRCSGKPDQLSLPDATIAIACGDGDDQSNFTKKDFEEYYRELDDLSPSAGAIWARLRMPCVHYTIRPHHRFVGPWAANTSHPLLFVGNSADPVTPVRNAFHMAAGFPGAVTLVQDSPGHCTLAAASRCTTNYVRTYFQTGDLPSTNTTCQADELPFGEGTDGAHDFVGSSELRSDTARIHSALHASGGGLLRQPTWEGGAESW